MRRTERVASMGFCFGGGHSLQLGMRQSENLALTIMYYGAVVTDPDLLRPMVDGQSVLGIFGADDQSIPTQSVLEFEAALNSLDIENQITIYPGVGHAFLNEDNSNQPGPASDAWQQTLGPNGNPSTKSCRSWRPSGPLSKFSLGLTLGT